MQARCLCALFLVTLNLTPARAQSTLDLGGIRGTTVVNPVPSAAHPLRGARDGVRAATAVNPVASAAQPFSVTYDAEMAQVRKAWVEAQIAVYRLPVTHPVWAGKFAEANELLSRLHEARKRNVVFTSSLAEARKYRDLLQAVITVLGSGPVYQVAFMDYAIAMLDVDLWERAEREMTRPGRSPS